MRVAFCLLGIVCLLSGCASEAALTKEFFLREARPSATTQGTGTWAYRFLSADDEQRVRDALPGSLPDTGMRERLQAVLAQVDRGWIPDGMSLPQLTNDALCAWTAARTRCLLLGLPDDSVEADGLVGDAWTFQVTVPAHGGQVVWKLGQGSFDPEKLSPGDLIGIYYSKSMYNGRIQTRDALARWPLTYTHIACVAMTMAGDALLIHDFRAAATDGRRPWPVRIELLSRMLQRFAGLLHPRIVLRPASSLGVGAAPTAD